MNGPTVDVEVEDAAWTDALPGAEHLAAAAARAALHAGEVTVLLADDAAVRDLNARFRGRDAATNVLSFPAPPSAAPHRGDVALAYGVCAREAVEQGKPLAYHLQHLVVHGVLHLLGSDHQHDAEAEEMEAAERAILARLGVPDPYAAPGSARDAATDEA